MDCCQPQHFDVQSVLFCFRSLHLGVLLHWTCTFQHSGFVQTTIFDLSNHSAIHHSFCEADCFSGRIQFASFMVDIHSSTHFIKPSSLFNWSFISLITIQHHSSRFSNNHFIFLFQFSNTFHHHTNCIIKSQFNFNTSTFMGISTCLINHIAHTMKHSVPPWSYPALPLPVLLTLNSNLNCTLFTTHPPAVTATAHHLLKFIYNNQHNSACVMTCC